MDNKEEVALMGEDDAYAILLAFMQEQSGEAGEAENALNMLRAMRLRLRTGARDLSIRPDVSATCVTWEEFESYAYSLVRAAIEEANEAVRMFLGTDGQPALMGEVNESNAEYPGPILVVLPQERTGIIWH